MPPARGAYGFGSVPVVDHLSKRCFAKERELEMAIHNESAAADRGIQAHVHSPSNSCKYATLTAQGFTIFAETKHACAWAEQVIGVHTMYAGESARLHPSPYGR